MAVVGGTASQLGGGKFSNGAVTAVFVHMYNSEWEDRMARQVAFNRDGKMYYPNVAENMKRFFTGLRDGFVKGLQNINTISTVGGIAAGYEGDVLSSLVYDSVAAGSDVLLYIMDEQSFSSIMIDYGIDAITPDSTSGKVSGTLLKQYIKGL